MTEWHAHMCVQVDQLLAVQFREDMVRITEHVGRRAPGGRQTILVSATLNQKVRTRTPLTIPLSLCAAPPVSWSRCPWTYILIHNRGLPP